MQTQHCPTPKEQLRILSYLLASDVEGKSLWVGALGFARRPTKEPS